MAMSSSHSGCGYRVNWTLPASPAKRTCPEVCALTRLLQLEQAQHPQQLEPDAPGVTKANMDMDGLLSLWALGATTERFDEFYADHCLRFPASKTPDLERLSETGTTPLSEPPAVVAQRLLMTLPDGAWDKHLGHGPSLIERRKHFEEYRSFFAGLLRTYGIRATLSRYLPRLITGIAGAPLCHIAHLGLALEAHHRAGGYFEGPIMVNSEEQQQQQESGDSLGMVLIPEALAHLCDSYTPMELPSLQEQTLSSSSAAAYATTSPSPSPSSLPLQPLDIIVQLTTSPALADLFASKAFAHSNFVHRLTMVRQLKGDVLTKYATMWPRVEDVHWDSHQRDIDPVVEEPVDKNVYACARLLVETAVKVFYSTGCRDAVLLEAITACYGMKNCLGMLISSTEQLRLVQATWIAFMATYLAQGRRAPDLQLLDVFERFPEGASRIDDAEHQHSWQAIADQAVARKNLPTRVYEAVHCLREISYEWDQSTRLFIEAAHAVLDLASSMEEPK